MTVFADLLRKALAPIAKAVYRPVVEGLEHVPDTGSVILASNHLSFSDSMVIPLVIPRQVAFLAKADYFEGKGIKNRLVAAFFTSMGHVPVERGKGGKSLGAVDSAVEVLNQGRAFCIYPEGTRSLDGNLHRGHTGVAQMALMTRSIVVPVGLIGTEKIQPVGSNVPKLAKVTIRFGKPLDFSRYDGMLESPVVRRAITDEIMYAIAELSGQTYVDKYHKRPDAA